VPVLDTGEALLAQSVAIAEYLEALFPTPALLPGDELARAQVREMVNMISSEIQPLGNLRVLNALRQDFGQNDDGVRHWVQTWIGRGFEAFERRAAERSANGQFCFRDSLTLADAWLMPQVYNAERFDVDLAPYPTIQSIVKHCGAIDTVAAAHPSRQPDAPPQQ
jgi:maleylacetoacetate isomerase